MKLKLASIALLILASLLAVSSQANAKKEKPIGIRDIVLVHGAFADGSSWSAVTAILQREGYHVTAVQNPLTSLSDDVAATKRVLARQGNSVILVGHSWAGAVVTEAGNAPNVKGIVYLSALVPDSGESVADLLSKQKAPMDGMKPDQNGFIWLDNTNAYRHVMASDVPLAKVRLLAAAEQPIAAHAFEEKIDHAAWLNKPTWYLITENDHALPTRVQRWTANHIGAHTVSLYSSHMSLVSHPRDVAALIATAARSVGH